MTPSETVFVFVVVPALVSVLIVGHVLRFWHRHRECLSTHKPVRRPCLCKTCAGQALDEHSESAIDVANEAPFISGRALTAYYRDVEDHANDANHGGAL